MSRERDSKCKNGSQRGCSTTQVAQEFALGNIRDDAVALANTLGPVFFFVRTRTKNNYFCVFGAKRRVYFCV